MKRPLLALGLSAALLLAALPALGQSDDPCFDVGGLTQDDGQCLQSAAVEISSVYPLAATNISDGVTEAINDYIQNAYNEMVGQLAGGFVPSHALPWTLNIQSSVLDGVSTVSVVFERYVFMGGANGNTDYHTITALVDGGTLLTLPDIFVEGVDPYTTLQPLAVAALTETLGEMAVPDMMAEGTAPTAENYQNWALTADSLNLYFNEYQVAPGAAGALVVSIPLSELADVLQPQYLPS